MLSKIQRAAQFIRLTDETGNLSLTNIALGAILTRLLSLPTIDTESLITFVVALVGYQIKRGISTFAGQQVDTTANADLAAAVASLQTKMVALQLGQKLNK